MDEKEREQEREMLIRDLENENHQGNVNCYKTKVSPLSEDEIDHLLKIHVTTQDNSGFHCSHSQ